MSDNPIDLLPRSDEWPQFDAINITDGEAKILMRVNEGVVWFDGHFPHNPVLPGVVQVHWAAHLGKLLFTHLPDFSSMVNLKFNNVILPGSQITLTLSYNSEKNSVKFLYNHGAITFSSGTLVFSAL